MVAICRPVYVFCIDSFVNISPLPYNASISVEKHISASGRKEMCFVQMILFIDSRQNRKTEGILSSREPTTPVTLSLNSPLNHVYTPVNVLQNERT